MDSINMNTPFFIHFIANVSNYKYSTYHSDCREAHVLNRIKLFLITNLSGL